MPSFRWQPDAARPEDVAALAAFLASDEADDMSCTAVVHYGA